MSYPISSPASVEAPGPVELRFDNTGSLTKWKSTTDLLDRFQHRTDVQEVLNLYPDGTSESFRHALRRAANKVTLDTDPGIGVNYTFNFPASAPTGDAQIITSSGFTNVFWDVHPKHTISVRKNPGPNEFSSVAAAIASIPVDPAPDFPEWIAPAAKVFPAEPRCYRAVRRARHW